MTEWQLIGHSDVDSGQIAIVDPCYVMSEKDYDELLNEDMSDGTREIIHGFASGMVVSSGHGDGTYPVYVKKDKDGTILEAKIVFVEGED